MVLSIDRYSDIDERKLMDIYSESNSENTDYFFPDEADKQLALKKVEEGFLEFLKNEFFTKDGNSYRVLEENGIWVCALRLSRIEDGIYYVEALETHPDHRQKGYAVKLYRTVQQELKASGSFRLCACVAKTNTPSVKAHLKSGFRLVLGTAHDYLTDEDCENDYGFEYVFDAEKGSVSGITLEPMTRGLFHELQLGFEYDPDLFMDMELYEKCHASRYDAEKVDAHYEERISRNDCMTFAIMLDERVIGEVVLKHIDRVSKQCELGIHLINDSVKGKGCGTEAERLAIEYAFNTLGMDRIFADSIIKNKRSQHILDKLGFIETGEKDGFKLYMLERKK